MKISKKMFLVIDENMRLCLYIKLKICDERERERASLSFFFVFGFVNLLLQSGRVKTYLFCGGAAN